MISPLIDAHGPKVGKHVSQLPGLAVWGPRDRSQVGRRAEPPPCPGPSP